LVKSVVVFQRANAAWSVAAEAGPVVLLGHAYWDGLVDWLRSTVLAGGKINEKDLALFSVTDDPAEAVRLVSLADQALGITPEPSVESVTKGPE
jgi:predicted Rossmann-fold nucleotide-binding protein